MHAYRPFPTSPLAILASLKAHLGLIAQMTRRDILGRYRGSALGLAWSFVTPLLMLGVYTFVFTSVFAPRWAAGSAANTGDFALILFAGLIIHAFFAECMTRAPSIILQHSNFVTKVIFPLEILPLTIVASALFHLKMSLMVLLGALLLLRGGIPATALLLPIVLLPFIILTLGLCWWLASVGVFLRDIGQLIGLAMTVLMFLSPVFYPVSALPEFIRPFIYLNPLTFMIEETRQVLLWGNDFGWRGWLYYLAGATLVMISGFWWFQKTRKGFADVL